MTDVKKVLVADDNEYNREIFTLGLMSAGYLSVEVGDGEQALLALGTHQFELMILDISMPHMDGRQLLHKLRGDKPLYENLKIFVITANFIKEEDEVHRLADAVILKPFQIKEVVDKVKQLLDPVVV